MRTIRTKVYKFNELSEDAKQKAIQYFADINVDYDWWQFVFALAENIGLTIKSFNIYKRDIEVSFNNNLLAIADKIIPEFLDTEDIVKEAIAFKKEWNELVERYSDGIDKNKVSEGNESKFDEKADTLEDYFKNDIKQFFLSFLSKEYEYLTSIEAITESIESNEYEFTQDGKFFK